MGLSAIEILETIRDNADNIYIERVPSATKENLGQVGDAITSNENIMNSFLESLINKICLSNVKSRLFKNPLARLKQTTGRPLGNTIEEIFINPSVDTGYDTDGTKLLKTTKPDGKVCYYGLNRQSSYPISINESELKRAFSSEQEFMSLYDGIVTSMLSGSQVDEFMLMKALVGKAIDNDSVNKIECDIAKPKEVAKILSNLSKNFQFPNSKLCGYNLVNEDKINAETEKACITFCDTSRQVLLIRSDVQTEIDYEVLATMFHMEVAKLEAMTILVDTIPSDKFDTYALLMDIDTIQVRDTVFKTTSQYIASSLIWNFWLHHWQFL